MYSMYLQICILFSVAVDTQPTQISYLSASAVPFQLVSQDVLKLNDVLKENTCVVIAVMCVN